jgi:hypothetical protein
MSARFSTLQGLTLKINSRRSMDQEDEIVRKDKLQYPNCNYSRALSKSCSTKDGAFVCETVKRVTRLCPNQKPVTVYSNSSTTNSKDDDTGNDGFISPFDLFKELNRGGSFAGIDFGGIPPPHTRQPPPPPPPPRQVQLDDGETIFDFRFGGKLVDGNEGPGEKSGSGMFGWFGFKDGEKQKPEKPKDGVDGGKKPPGRPMGPSEDI